MGEATRASARRDARAEAHLPMSQSDEWATELLRSEADKQSALLENRVLRARVAELGRSFGSENWKRREAERHQKALTEALRALVNRTDVVECGYCPVCGEEGGHHPAARCAWKNAEVALREHGWKDE